MNLIDGNTAQHGLTIVADSQTGGKGQRGKTWADEPGQSLLMSIILVPRYELAHQFMFNASVAVAVAKVLQELYTVWRVRIKWPNDIIINDKKAGGILIENVLRGNSWTHSVVGLGLNILQDSFPPELPFAISLKIASGIDFERAGLLHDVRNALLENTMNITPLSEQLMRYNQLLYQRGQKQVFYDSSARWETTILGALSDGTLEVQPESGCVVAYQHGQALWEYR